MPCMQGLGRNDPLDTLEKGVGQVVIFARRFGGTVAGVILWKGVEGIQST